MGEKSFCLSFTNKLNIFRLHFKATVCAMIMSATTERYRSFKHLLEGDGKLWEVVCLIPDSTDH